MMNHARRVALRTWFYLIETRLPKGESKVVATLCSMDSVETLKASLQNTPVPEGETRVFSIDRAPIYEPNRRCDTCVCST
jgi:hypothetical protein